MTDLARQKELCIKVIRSHLISCPGGLTIPQLERDYFETEKKRLPCQIFGYSDTLSFLKSLTNVVNIDYRGSQIRLFGIADESSKHVKNLIDHQKLKRNRKGPPRIYSNTIRRPTTRGHIPKNWNPSVASAYLQQHIHKVVQKLKAGMSLPLFCDLYEKEIGLPLDGVRHGFASTADLLKSVPEICHLEFGRRDRSGNALYVCPPRQRHDLNKICPSNPACDKPQEPAISSTAVHNVTSKPVNTTVKTEVKETQLYETKVACSNAKSDRMLTKVQLESEIIELLKDHPKGVTASKIPALYEEKFKKYMDIKKWGYYSVIEFISKINGEIVITRPQNTSDWVICLCSLIDKNDASQSNSYEEEELLILKLELREILLRAGKEIMLEKLPDIYERTYHHRINVEGENRNELMNLIFKIQGATISNRNNNLMVSVEHSDRIRSKIPPDAVGPNTSYRLPKLPTVEDHYIDVYVADVTDPSCFSIQLYGRRTTGALNELMDSLEKFYCSLDEDQYELPSCMVKPGQICAAVFMEDLNWHRATVVGAYDSNYVEVLYVDYGTIATVPTTSLKLLKSCFLSLPTQMIKARLSHIKPRNLKSWTLEARNDMLQMCRNKQLIALVSDVQSNVLSLCLCDTTDPDVDIHINDTLVDMKHAVVFPDSLNDGEKQKLSDFYEQQFEEERNGAVIDLENAVPEFLQSIRSRPTSFEISHDSFVAEDRNISFDNDRSPEEDPVYDPARANANSEVPPPLMDCHSGTETNIKSHETRNRTSGHFDTAAAAEISTEVKVPYSSSSGLMESHDVSSERQTSSPKMRWYVQKNVIVNRTYTLHVINFQGKPMVTSYEIALMFGYTSDILRPMLCMNNLTFSELIVGRDCKHEDLFESVEDFRVPRAAEENSLTDVLCLYHLVDVISIVMGLGHPHKGQMIQDITSILISFDGSSDYWFSDTVDAHIEEEILMNLRSRRKELIESRITLLEQLAEKSNSDTVDQIMEVEQKIYKITQKIATNQSKKDDNHQESNCQTEASTNKRPRIYKPCNPSIQNPKHPEKQKLANAHSGAPSCPKTLDGCPPLLDISKNPPIVAEVTPYQQQERRDKSTFSVIPGAQLRHDVIEFTPRSLSNNFSHQSLMPGGSGSVMTNQNGRPTDAVESNLPTSMHNRLGSAPSMMRPGYVRPFAPSMAQSGAANSNTMYFHQQFTPTQGQSQGPNSTEDTGMRNYMQDLVPQTPMPFQHVNLLPVSHNGGPGLYRDAHGRMYLSQVSPQRVTLPAPTNCPVYYPRMNC